MMGADRWGQGSSMNGSQGNTYRNSYHRGNYRGDGNFGGGYGKGSFGHGNMHYDNGAYDASKVDRSSSEHMTAIGQKRDATENPGAPAAVLEEKIATAQSEMSQALQEATHKENEKFDLIFSILMELQTRQSKLEESLKCLKQQYESNGGQLPMMAQSVPMPSGQGDGLQPTSPLGSSMTSPMGSPMGSQVGMMASQMGMVGGQMPTHQMVMMDSSGNCMVPMLVPQNGGQMQFTQMMMPQGAPMQGMPQQQVQFVASSGQGTEGCGDFQWNGGGQADASTSSTTAGGQQSSSSIGSGSGSGPGTARSTGEQAELSSKTMDPSQN